jgi:hydroxymethylbilane synthase
MTPLLRVATRGSALALAQTRQLVQELERHSPDCSFEIITLTTTGDRVTDRPLSQFRGIGVFVKEIEKALLDGQADLAVHSLKDVPVERVEGLTPAAFPKRNKAADLLLTRTGAQFGELPPGAVIGTSSLRRLVQLRAIRPDLAFKDLRGNLDTRLRKLEEGQYDGIVAAAAGMLRLGRRFSPESMLPFSVCLPAAGQGCLVIECRAADTRSQAIAAKVNDETTRLEVSAERDFLRAIGGGCQTPIAVYAKITGARLAISAAIGDPETGKLARETMSFDKNTTGLAGAALADRMLVLCNNLSIRIAS